MIIDALPGVSVELEYEPDRQLAPKVEKYRLKLDKSWGIGILCSDASFCACTATLLEFPWQEDDETAKLVNEQPMMTPIKTNKLPGRNQPCFCGSLLKFKMLWKMLASCM